MSSIGDTAQITRIRVAEQASAPATPASGYGLIFEKTDGILYFLNDAGVETPLGTGAAGVTSLNTLTGAVQIEAVGAGLAVGLLSGNVLGIANTGVTSVNSMAGGVTLQAGSGVTITPLTGNVLEISASASAGVSDLNGLTGPVTLQAGTNITLNLLSGNVIEIVAAGGGGGSPGGSTTQVQYNNAGSFGGISLLTSDGTNITFGTAARIKGDYANATVANRPFFQSSVTNDPSVVAVIPNGTSNIAGFNAFNSSSPNDSAYLGLALSNVSVALDSSRVGGGTALPLVIRVGASTTQAVYISTSGSVRFGSTFSDPTAVFQVDGATALFAATSFTWSGATARLLGDFSNATLSTKTSFQSSTTNGATVVQALPNGSSTVSAWVAVAAATPTNANYCQIVAAGTDCFLDALAYGSGTPGPLYFRTGAAVNRASIDALGNVAINTAAIATTATDGFLYLPTCAGIPTGTPTTKTGLSPIVIDSTNARLRYYTGSAWRGEPFEIQVAVSDETTALTTGTAKVTFRMPRAMTLTAVRASVTTAPTGSVLTVDINESGSTILSTKITIDASEKTSTTAATPPVISDAALADDAEITIDIDTVGSTVAGTGLKVTLIGY